MKYHSEPKRNKLKLYLNMDRSQKYTENKNKLRIRHSIIPFYKNIPMYYTIFLSTFLS